ncbi:GTP-binding protein YchF [Thecamonas trahens ATCC 50062]|uniref:GTP-binding protein YchF n=1 Tax=Thecamonas trahens ATCC 50062 TaxID=461836 RepID=A0A0L0DSH8_THETB|nr:GTP-binding protein YchF [Thecamonas trahens ATCC 50062]KNC54991.1 GTP-binding protein YchF [Thecamonas trahens ATCC 50062]|eukprot:XP_013753436.1 GTP-binding protein YchF [Thecamonas trahens ATCC 50062]
MSGGLRKLLGRRFTSSLRIGLVGLPNVGKSALYNLVTAEGAGVASENYPFCTIDPSTAAAVVGDEVLDGLQTVAPGAKMVPALLNVTDIAGLVAGAAEGEGLGNKFLAEIREADAIAHIVRCFDDGRTTHVVSGLDRPSPADDVATIETELALADVETTGRALARAKGKGALATGARAVVGAVHDHLQGGGGMVASMGEGLRNLLDEHPEGAQALRALQLLTAKPVVYVANVGDDWLTDGSGSGAMLAELTAAVGGDSAVVPVPVALEAELADLDAADADEYLVELGLPASAASAGSQKLIHTAYSDCLDLGSFYTCGETEVRAWTIQKGMTAREAAKVIHADFYDAFVKMEARGTRARAGADRGQGVCHGR